jgi:hypothetical protein
MSFFERVAQIATLTFSINKQIINYVNIISLTDIFFRSQGSDVIDIYINFIGKRLFNQ